MKIQLYIPGDPSDITLFLFVKFYNGETVS